MSIRDRLFALRLARLEAQRELRARRGRRHLPGMCAYHADLAAAAIRDALHHRAKLRAGA